MTPAVLITPLGERGGTRMRWLEAKREGKERGARRGKGFKHKHDGEGERRIQG